MKYQNILIALFAFALLFTGCRKDGFVTDINKTPTTPLDFYETTIEGFVVDKDQVGISEAIVTLGTQSTTTNSLGYFKIAGVGNQNSTALSISKDGYFDNFKTYRPSKNLSAVSQTRVQLTRKTVTANFLSSQGGSVSINGQSQINFQSNSIVDSDGNDYDGNVLVYAYYIDPTADNINEVMPGNLSAINAEDEFNVLQSFGMLNIELASTTGEELNINAPTTLEVEVPSDLIGNAPSQLPLWYFDESDGLWKEEGFAELQGGKYVGEVTHFTTWNCDVPFEAAFIEGIVSDEQGVSAVKVFLEDNTTGVQYSIWTDSEGEFFGVVPADIEYTITIQGLCDSDGFLSTDVIGPFAAGSDNDLGTIDISNNNGFTLVSGILVDCDMNPVAAGEVYFDYPDFSYTVQTVTDANGNFRLNIPSCEGEDVSVRGVDPSTGLVSDVIIFNINGDFQDVGTISVCIDISPTLGSVTLTYNGIVKEFDNCTVDIQPNNVGATSYVITYSELLPPLNDPISYIMLISDSNNSLVNPSWNYNQFFWSPPLSAEDEEYEYFVPNFNTNVQNITTLVVQAADSPGEILKLNMSDVTLRVRIKNVAGSSEDFVSDISIEAVVLQ